MILLDEDLNSSDGVLNMWRGVECWGLNCLLASSLLVVAWRTFDDENCLSFLFAFVLGINFSKMLAKSGADRNIVKNIRKAHHK